MKYTYKDECFVSDRGDAGLLIFLGVCACFTLLLFFIDGAVGIGGPVTGCVFGGFTLLMAARVYVHMQKRRKKALAFRRKALTAGSRYTGRIVDAGTEIESESYQVQGENNRTETRYKKVTNHWIAVEYFDAEAGAYKGYRGKYMNKSLRDFIGCEVAVYVWHEWDVYIQGDFVWTYIDISHLGAP